MLRPTFRLSFRFDFLSFRRRAGDLRDQMGDTARGHNCHAPKSRRRTTLTSEAASTNPRWRAFCGRSAGPRGSQKIQGKARAKDFCLCEYMCLRSRNIYGHQVSVVGRNLEVLAQAVSFLDVLKVS